MWRFCANLKKEEHWSPILTTECPHCTAELSFYTQLRDNRCKYCFQVLPYPSSMVKSVTQRVKYHVSTAPKFQPVD
jgi:hypothetical protein